MPGFDYSKWDKLDISDDEDDYHPNIDSSLMIRIKREQRAKREAEEEVLRQQYLADGSPEAMKKLEELEKNKRLHVDNICRVVEDRTVIKEAAPAVKKRPKPRTEEEEELAMHGFHAEFGPDLDKYANMSSLDDAEVFLRDNSQIICEDGCAYLLLKMLDLEMENQRQKSIECTRQYLMMRNIMDLAKEQPGLIEDIRQVVPMFFQQIKGKEFGEKLEEEARSFQIQIQKRAADKRKEMDQLIQSGEMQVQELTEEEMRMIEKETGEKLPRRQVAA